MRLFFVCNVFFVHDGVSLVNTTTAAVNDWKLFRFDFFLKREEAISQQQRRQNQDSWKLVKIYVDEERVCKKKQHWITFLDYSWNFFSLPILFGVRKFSLLPVPFFRFIRGSVRGKINEKKSFSFAGCVTYVKTRCPRRAKKKCESLRGKQKFSLIARFSAFCTRTHTPFYSLLVSHVSLDHITLAPQLK